MNPDIARHAVPKMLCHGRCGALDGREDFDIAPFQHSESVGRALRNNAAGLRVSVSVNGIRRQREAEARECLRGGIYVRHHPSDMVKIYLACVGQLPARSDCRNLLTRVLRGSRLDPR